LLYPTVEQTAKIAATP